MLKIILANLFTLTLAVLIAWLWHVTAGRRRLTRFFGLAKDASLRIFVGNLGGPKDAPGLVAFEESAEARNLEGLFRSFVPGLSDRGGLWRLLQVGDVEVTVLRGCLGDPAVNLDHSLISLGSPMSNHASALLENELRSPVRLEVNRNPWAIEIPGLAPIESTSRGVIVRLCRDDKCYFYLFGITEPGTCLAARYLLRHWRSISQKYPDGVSFYYVVEPTADGAGAVVAIADRDLPRGAYNLRMSS